MKVQREVEEIVRISEVLLELYDDSNLDYQKITDEFLQISEAKYAAFNLYDEDGRQFTTVAISGGSETIKKASEMLGFKIEGKKWQHDTVREQKIKTDTVTRFSSLTGLVGNVIPIQIVTILEGSFNVEETVVIKIQKNNTLIGDFTICMAKGTKFSKDNIAKVYTRQLGMIIMRKRAEEKLLNSEASLKEAQSMARLGRWEIIHSTNTLIWSDIIFDIFEINKEEFGASCQAFLDAIHPDDGEMVNRAWVESLQSGKPYKITHRLLMKDARIKWVTESGETAYDSHGKPIKSVGIVQDITDQKRIEELLFIEKERFRTTLLSIGDGVISTDDRGTLLILNKVAEQLTGWTQEEAFGKPLAEVFNIINEFTREKCQDPVLKALEDESTTELANHTILISRDGVERPIEDSVSLIKDDQNKISGVVLVFRDATEKRERQAEVEYLSFHDQLTGLYNRRFFEEELKRLNTERNLPITLAMIDVNGLKLVNDAFGHLVGDEVLKRVAEVMKKECRADDIIARIGGDEFVILLPRTNSKQAQIIVQRIHDLIALEKLESIYLSSSYGWETKQGVEEVMAAVFKKAEDNMYRRKLSESTSMRHKTIEIIIKTLYEKNESEERHSKGVSEFCAAIGTALNLSTEDVSELAILGLMHDIGKISLDDKILNKIKPLKDIDWQEIKRHSEIGYRILSSVNEYAPLAEYVLAHHERWDGKGYPKGLKGQEIPLEARIIAVADAYDAMISDRPYRKALSPKDALEEIRINAGAQFDPDIAKIFIEKVLGKESDNNLTLSFEEANYDTRL